MAEEIRSLLLEVITEPPAAMRTEINRDEIFELAADIKKNGLINPITVRPVEWCVKHNTKYPHAGSPAAECEKGERFEVVAGHRRLLAHRYGGLLSIKCVVRDLSDDEAFAVMTSENLAREDVNPVDEATHTKRLLELHKGDVGKIKEILNRGESWIVSRLAIADMDDGLKQALREGKIKLGVALALAQIKDDLDRKVVLNMAITQGASVIMAQYWLAQWNAGLFGHATAQDVPDSNAPDGHRRIIMLRDAIDGQEYPAEEFSTILVVKKNLGYIDALREHLKASKTEIENKGGDDTVVAPATL